MFLNRLKEKCHIKAGFIIAAALLFVSVMLLAGCMSDRTGWNSDPEPQKIVRFAGYDWKVKFGDKLGPGPNYFSDDEDNIWVDESGLLHMTIKKQNDKWFCTEIINSKSLGYGSYIFTLKSRVDKLDQNIVLGMFTWDTYAPQYNHREIDFEFGRWQDPENNNSQFVIQPWDGEGNIYRYDINYDGTTETTTHVMTWRDDGIYFKSYYGRYVKNPSAQNMINSWTYKGKDNPPPGGENMRFNLWLVRGLAPTDDKNVEFVFEDFKYIP